MAANLNDITKFNSTLPRCHELQFALPGRHMGGIGGFGYTRPQSSGLGRSQPAKYTVTKCAPGSRAVLR
ncbi:MAG: hypothetical protein WBD68_22095, partial [Candidatus Sulfotelmatobacter sp.]